MTTENKGTMTPAALAVCNKVEQAKALPMFQKAAAIEAAASMTAALLLVMAERLDSLSAIVAQDA